MGFFSSLVSSVVKTALTPVSILTDTVEVIKGNEPNNTKNLLKSAGEDLSDAIEDVEDQLG